jgi:hypothetical protein
MAGQIPKCMHIDKKSQFYQAETSRGAWPLVLVCVSSPSGREEVDDCSQFVCKLCFNIHEEHRACLVFTGTQEIV